MNRDRPEVKFYEPSDASFDREFTQYQASWSDTVPGCIDCEASMSWEALALFVVGLGLFAVAIIVSLARYIKKI